MSDYVDALRRELDGYLVRGQASRAEQVQAEIDRVSAAEPAAIPAGEADADSGTSAGDEPAVIPADEAGSTSRRRR